MWYEATRHTWSGSRYCCDRKRRAADDDVSEVLFCKGDQPRAQNLEETLLQTEPSCSLGNA